MQKRIKYLIQQDWIRRRLNRKSLFGCYLKKYYYKNNEEGC
jgi:hypothetical protein